jgi:hypothetical protein
MVDSDRRQREIDMDSSEIRELTLAELEQAAGGNLDGWRKCSDGLTPAYNSCSTWGDVIRGIISDVQAAGRRGSGQPA